VRALPAPAVPPTRATDQSQPSGLFVAGETRFLGFQTALVGGRVGGRFGFLPHLLLVAEAGALWTRNTSSRGTLDATIATAAVTVFGVGGSRDITLGAGPRIEGGLGWFSGQASGPTVQSSDATSPLAFVALSAAAWFRLRGEWSAFCGVDVGTTLQGFVAKTNRDSALDITGALVATRIGFAWDVRP
jgi:hypothetical protein